MDSCITQSYSTVARVASGRPTNYTLEWIRELTLRYTTPDIHCRYMRHECDGGISIRREDKVVERLRGLGIEVFRPHITSIAPIIETRPTFNVKNKAK